MVKNSKTEKNCFYYCIKNIIISLLKNVISIFEVL